MEIPQTKGSRNVKNQLCYHEFLLLLLILLDELNMVQNYN